MIDNLSLYRFFVTAADAGSISGAARRLYITQPAVSSGIMQLENALGVKLFFRTSRGINLTPEGEILYEYATSAMAFLKAGEEKLRDIGGLKTGVMRVGASDMTLKFYLLDHIEDFNNRFPKIKLSVTNNPTPQTLAALKNGKIDFCVVSEPVATDPDITFEPVRSIKDVVVCSRKLAADYLGEDKIKRGLTFDELAALPIIMLEHGTSTRTYIDRHLRKSGAPDELLNPAIELAQSELVLEFALRQIGAAFIVRDFAKEALDSGRLIELELAQPIPERSFLLAYLRKIPLSAASRHFTGGLTRKM